MIYIIYIYIDRPTTTKISPIFQNMPRPVRLPRPLASPARQTAEVFCGASHDFSMLRMNTNSDLMGFYSDSMGY